MSRCDTLAHKRPLSCIIWTAFLLSPSLALEGVSHRLAGLEFPGQCSKAAYWFSLATTCSHCAGEQLGKRSAGMHCQWHCGSGVLEHHTSSINLEVLHFKSKLVLQVCRLHKLWHLHVEVLRNVKFRPATGSDSQDSERLDSQ